MIPKLRAWHKNIGKMFEVRFIDFDTKLIGLNIDLEIIIFDFDDVIIMESTVLKDKNGKEIFDGDILHGKDDEGDFWDIVKYDKDNAVWIRGCVYYSSPLNLSENVETLSVVGNIYENPEILR